MSSVMAARGVAVQLECGAWRYLPVREVLHTREVAGVHHYAEVVARCPLHDRVENVTRVRDMEWLAECASCSWSRWGGADRTVAERMAQRHTRQRYEHRVRVLFATVPGLEYYRLVAPASLWKES